MSDKHGRIVLYGDTESYPDWEGVIDDIEIESLPIGYMIELVLNMEDGGRTIIDVPAILERTDDPTVSAQYINNLIQENAGHISSIDFKIDMERLQQKVDDARNAFTKKVNKTYKEKNKLRKKQKGKGNNES